MPAISAIRKERTNEALASEFLNTQQAATFLNVSASFLNKARLTGGGPRYCKMGHAVRYEKAQLIEWATENARRSTSDNEGN